MIMVLIVTGVKKVYSAVHYCKLLKRKLLKICLFYKSIVACDNFTAFDIVFDIQCCNIIIFPMGTWFQHSGKIRY